MITKHSRHFILDILVILAQEQLLKSLQSSMWLYFSDMSG